jgi:hypothetical protein
MVSSLRSHLSKYGRITIVILVSAISGRSSSARGSGARVPPTLRVASPLLFLKITHSLLDINDTLEDIRLEML